MISNNNNSKKNRSKAINLFLKVLTEKEGRVQSENQSLSMY